MSSKEHLLEDPPFKENENSPLTNLPDGVEDSTQQSSNAKTASEINYRPDGVSTFATLINFLKGMIGPGCLSLPLAFKQSGIWAGLVLVVVLGFLNNYCIVRLVESSQALSKKKGQSLDYGNVAYEACAHTFKPLRKFKAIFKYSVNTVIIFFQFGLCSVCYVFISAHIKEIVEHNSTFRQSSTIWNLMVFPLMVAVSLLNSLKAIAYLSLAGNFAMLGSLIYIVQYLIRMPHKSFHDLSGITNFDGILMACGSIMYTFEGQSMILPMENKMKHPKKMVGTFGIIPIGLVTVTVAYAVCGFLGYLAYGDEAEGSIALNFPSRADMYVLKGLLIFVVYIGFTIQQYVIVDLMWAGLKRLIHLNTENKRMLDLCTESTFRILLVIFEMGMATLIPRLDSIIPLVGASAGILLAFIFPTIISALTFGPEWGSTVYRDIKWKLILFSLRDFLLCLLGVFCLVTSLRASILKL